MSELTNSDFTSSEFSSGEFANSEITNDVFEQHGYSDYGPSSHAPMNQASRNQPGSDHVPGRRFCLWIDGVGGYLVCEGSEVILGQPVEGVEIPLLGDVSRRHALLRRDGENYLVIARGEVRVEGKKVESTSTLRDGQLLQLGDGVRLRFRQPHACSQTARLDFVSHHRTQPLAHAVLLMADACVLGPEESSHVVCPRWTQELVIYRQGDGLACRMQGDFEIDRQPVRGRGPLSRSSHVSGEGFSLSLEELP
jgi:hypothetical protein